MSRRLSNRNGMLMAARRFEKVYERRTRKRVGYLKKIRRISSSHVASDSYPERENKRVVVLYRNYADSNLNILFGRRARVRVYRDRSWKINGEDIGGRARYFKAVESYI